MQSPSTATRRPAKRWTMARRAAGSKLADMQRRYTRARRGSTAAPLDRARSALLGCPPMSRSIVPCRAEDLEVVRGLISDPSLADEFWTLLLPGTLEDLWRDPFADADLRWLALEAGAPVGFLFALVLPGVAHHWAMLRPGVLGPHRRRGIGSELLRVARARLAKQDSVREQCLSAWAPCEGAA